MSDQPEPKASVSPIKQLSGKIGRYEITRLLGKGAMGMVYLAHDTVLERDVALKVMVAQLADDPELKARFQREARAVARMTHPNVVTVFDLGELPDGSAYIAMELLKGQDLQKSMRQTPPLSLDQKVVIILKVLAGLAHAHEAGIVHRDIKPANIFLSVDGGVKIMDFGVERFSTASMTGTGSVVGTADYMSPEQVKGAKVDGRSDLFSVGCMLYELLAGRRPFHSENLMAVFYKITHEDANLDHIPTGPAYDALLPLIRKSMSRKPEERYQTAYEFANDLREYLKANAVALGVQVLETLPEIGPPRTTQAGTVAVEGMAGPGTTQPTMALPDTRTGTTSPRPGTASRPPTAARPTTDGRTDADRRPPTTVGRAIRAGAAPTMAPPHTAPRSGRSALFGVLGGLVVVAAGLGGYMYWTQGQARVEPAAPVTDVPPTMPPSIATPAPAPVTVETPPPLAPAPPPTFGEVQGKAAASMRAAQTAFGKGDYDRAIKEVQVVLREDPSNPEARRLAENAVNGQKAESKFRAAEAALRQGDVNLAVSEAEAGRTFAPWDGRATDLLTRAREAQHQADMRAQRAQQQKETPLAGQVNGLLSQADGALSTQSYDTAIKLYDEVLKLDPQNQRATLGRTSAVAARAVTQAAASAGSRGGPVRTFVSGKTSAQSAETRAGAGPAGFEESSGITVKKGAQAGELPGKIAFEIEPEGVKPGERYTVKIYLTNEGSAPIHIRELIVGTKINGRGVAGPVSSLTREVAPQQKALLLSLPDLWKEDTTSWSMEATVRTTRGDTYKNQVTWR